jgi:hypothetical protein
MVKNPIPELVVSVEKWYYGFEIPSPSPSWLQNSCCSFSITSLLNHLQRQIEGDFF